MQTRFTSCFQSSNLSTLLDLQGMARFPFPCEFVSVNLIQVNIAFDFATVAEPGFILLSIPGGATNLLVVNGVRYNYTWLLPFEPGGLTGNFQWFSQAAAAGDDLYHQTRFNPHLTISVSFVNGAGVCGPFPPTPPGRLCSLEVAIRPK